MRYFSSGQGVVFPHPLPLLHWLLGAARDLEHEGEITYHGKKSRFVGLLLWLKLIISPWHLLQNMEKYLQFLFSNLELDLTCFIYILITQLVWGGR